MKKIILFGLLSLIAALFFSCEEEDPCGIVKYVVECAMNDEIEERGFKIDYSPPYNAEEYEPKSAWSHSGYWSKSFTGCSGDYVDVSIDVSHINYLSDVTITVYFKGEVFKQTSELKTSTLFPTHKYYGCFICFWKLP